MSPLTLQPAITQLTRAEYEEHLEAVRARRMIAAIEYHEGKNAKYQHEADRIQRRMKGQNEMLGKEIMTLDKAIEKVEKRLATIANMDNELGIVKDMIVILDKEKGDE